MSEPTKVVFTEVCWGGRTLALKRPIECPVTREEGLCVVAYEPLGIRAYAYALEEALADFREEFLMLWTVFGKADDELTLDGQGLKRQLKELVDE